MEQPADAAIAGVLCGPGSLKTGGLRTSPLQCMTGGDAPEYPSPGSFLAFQRTLVAMRWSR